MILSILKLSKIKLEAFSLLELLTALSITGIAVAALTAAMVTSTKSMGRQDFYRSVMDYTDQYFSRIYLSFPDKTLLLSSEEMKEINETRIYPVHLSIIETNIDTPGYPGGVLLRIRRIIRNADPFLADVAVEAVLQFSGGNSKGSVWIETTFSGQYLENIR